MEEGARRLGIELINQYATREQAELKVRIKIPGSWFGGQLTSQEKLEQYWAQAKGSSEAHPFAATRGRRAQTCPAYIKVHGPNACEEDTFGDPGSDSDDEDEDEDTPAPAPVSPAPATTTPES